MNDHPLNTRFDVLLAWWDRDLSVDFGVVEGQVRHILGEHGIRLRQRDGELVQINFSLPQSQDSGLVLGLRYRKGDGSLTEDHFLCTQTEEGLTIDSYYRGDLERALREYLGTHKEQPNLTTALPSSADGFMTDPRTISFTKPIK